MHEFNEAIITVTAVGGVTVDTTASSWGPVQLMHGCCYCFPPQRESEFPKLASTGFRNLMPPVIQPLGTASCHDCSIPLEGCTP